MCCCSSASSTSLSRSSSAKSSNVSKRAMPPLLPKTEATMLRNVLYILLKLLFRVEVSGLENIQKAGKRALIIANHQSFLDAVLIAVLLPERPMFAINTVIARQWWMQPFLKIASTFPLDPTSPMATKKLIDEIKKDKHCVIFPEGRITTTGALMKMYNGPAMIADKSGAMLLPVRIDGAQYTFFSRLKGV
ncbi:MAG: hypothetical protein FJX23_02415, partial [Alphaproteobacteria bacterium]|nr:hypothetical protein [Alphaproteobacteria bacterium]